MGLKDEHPDRCIYPRPFPEGFDACPAFQATSFIAADSRNKPLGTWRTCRHLSTGNDVENRGRFYPRCALGDPAQRSQWVAQVSPAKLDVVRALQEEFGQVSRPHRERLLHARARLHSGPASAWRNPELEHLINAFLTTIDRFLQQNDARFRDVGLPAEPLRQLIKEWVWAWVRTPELATPRLGRKPLEIFAKPVRAFNGAPAEPAVSPARRLWDRPLYADTILQILPTMDPPGLALVGDVDRSNVAAVAQALARLRSHAGDVHLDLSGLLFCDLGGLQAIVRASQALEPGRRLVLHGIPHQLERALDIVDWAPLPNLFIAGGATA
jgi:ABC-type transporter Mla MlaB component